MQKTSGLLHCGILIGLFVAFLILDLLNDFELIFPLFLRRIIIIIIITSLIGNRLYTFAADNGCIETNIQKGFWEKISGRVEDIEALTHMINNARIKQRGCVITLLDLKNASGGVNHNLLVETLKIHHVLDNIITLITSLYTDYAISIITDTFMTLPIKVQRGVLQEDSLSPLLFNLIVDTLIKTIKSEKVECMGYVYNGPLSPKHWFQFADDTAIVTTLERDNQLLCIS